MAISTRDFPDGTLVRQSFPWGFFIGARARCTDGVIRRVKRISQTADTFFSVPASVEVRRHRKRHEVSGYITMDDDGVRFIAYSYGKNGHLLPGTKVES